MKTSTISPPSNQLRESATTDRVAAALGVAPDQVRLAILLTRSGRADLLDRVIAGNLDLRRALQAARIRGARS